MKYIDKIYNFIFKEPFRFLGPGVMEFSGIMLFLFIANSLYGNGTDSSQSMVFGGFLFGHFSKSITDGIGKRFLRINEKKD